MNTNEHKSPQVMKPLLTEIIIQCAMIISNSLGAGYLEKVYENALVHELKKHGLSVEQQKRIPVFYDGLCVGDYIADLIVEGKVLVELKACAGFSEEHTAICLNYLRAANLPVCLLFNFGKSKLTWKRFVSNSYDPTNPL